MIRAAVLGSPISHSLSPTLHTTAYQEMGLKGTFEAIEVRSGELGKFIEAQDSSWTGFSLTMPLKEEVIEIADVIDEIALQIASANTLTRSGDNWKVTSTDVNGFVQSLYAHGFREFESVVILGSGASARAAAAACSAFTKEIQVLHRSAKRESAMRNSAPNVEMNFSDWEAKVPRADLVINTTPAGVADKFIGQAKFNGVFFEALYNPWPTKILQYARSNGAYGIDGLELLIHQGIDQVSLMSGIAMDRGELAPILRAACLAKLGQ